MASKMGNLGNPSQGCSVGAVEGAYSRRGWKRRKEKKSAINDCPRPYCSPALPGKGQNLLENLISMVGQGLGVGHHRLVNLPDI